ncbi:MAG TPA: ABC transporter permease [Flavobacteriales bacterium]|nr:ABC transporter permease [Flavobacteriales bacterium]HMR28986.1 ABC transporter permease [Flavobacteriales bacterium]
MNKILLIIRREFITRVRKPSFLIMTILGPLLIAGTMVGLVYLGMQESDEHLVLVVDKPHVVTGKLRDTDKVRFFYAYDELGDSAFKASPYTLMVDVNEAILETNTIQLFYKDLPSMNVQRTVQSELERTLEREKLRVNQVDPDTYARIKTALNVQLFDIDKAGEESYEQVLAAVGFGFGYIMFFFVFLYAVQVMRGVLEEKSNRIVEVLISSVKPFQLMMGKIIGIALVGLAQFTIWIALTATLMTAGTALLMKDRLDPREVLAEQQMTGELQAELMKEAGAQAPDRNKVMEVVSRLNIPFVLGMFVFYFLAGYLLYSSLFAAVGSAVDSETDTQQFMFPVTLPMIVAIFIAQMAITNPGSPLVFWGSIIPFTSPVVMMVRVAMGSVLETPWQLILSMVLLVGTFLFTTWLAGRIYRTGILMYGKKVSWREMGRWMFYKG